MFQSPLRCIVGGSGAIENKAAAVLSPRKRRRKAREQTFKRVVRIVVSPFPYMVLLLLAAMVVMIFVNVMPISGLICVSSLAMVVSVVIGNHWRNQKIWEEDSKTARNRDKKNSIYQANNDGKVEEIKRRRKNNSENKLISNDKSGGNNGGAESIDVHNSSEQPDECESPPKSSQRHHKSLSVGASSKQIYNPLKVECEDDDLRQLVKQANHHQLQIDTASCKNDNDNTSIATAEDNDATLSRQDKVHNMNLFFEDLFQSIDYSLLLIFMGTFVVVENMASTGIPKFVW